MWRRDGVGGRGKIRAPLSYSCLMPSACRISLHTPHFNTIHTWCLMPSACSSPLSISLFSTLVVPTRHGRPLLCMRLISVTTARHLYCSTRNTTSGLSVRCTGSGVSEGRRVRGVTQGTQGDVQGGRGRDRRGAEDSCCPPISRQLSSPPGYPPSSFALRTFAGRFVGTTATGSL